MSFKEELYHDDRLQCGQIICKSVVRSTPNRGVKETHTCPRLHCNCHEYFPLFLQSHCWTECAFQRSFLALKKTALCVCIFVCVQTKQCFRSVTRLHLQAESHSGEPGCKSLTRISLFLPRALSRSELWTQTSTIHWVDSTASEDFPPSRSLGPIRTSQRSTKVQKSLRSKGQVREVKHLCLSPQN